MTVLQLVVGHLNDPAQVVGILDHPFSFCVMERLKGFGRHDTTQSISLASPPVLFGVLSSQKHSAA